MLQAAAVLTNHYLFHHHFKKEPERKMSCHCFPKLIQSRYREHDIDNSRSRTKARSCNITATSVPNFIWLFRATQAVTIFTNNCARFGRHTLVIKFVSLIFRSTARMHAHSLAVEHRGVFRRGFRK